MAVRISPEVVGAGLVPARKEARGGVNDKNHFCFKTTYRYGLLSISMRW